MNRRKLSSSFGLAAVAVLFGTTAIAGGHTAPAPAKDIVDTAVGAGSFTTLVAAVQAAGLVDTLKGSGPFTVWAPTDDAFAALPEGTVENLLKPENKDQLTAILLYHVVPGKTMSAQVKAWAVNGEDVATAQGSTVRAKISDDVISINNATVVGVDVVASNGVIHVIDTVLLPPEA